MRVFFSDLEFPGNANIAQEREFAIEWEKSQANVNEGIKVSVPQTEEVLVTEVDAKGNVRAREGRE